MLLKIDIILVKQKKMLYKCRVCNKDYKTFYLLSHYPNKILYFITVINCIRFVSHVFCEYFYNVRKMKIKKC